ncbi:urease accessory protein UreE [Marinobacter sp. F3R08]|uniref:urease accessory protein UreE n=1 Tax=Marinobacter sp. F3R08 TaxID=2841559 RepID=UPI001C08EC49|nr:urease accessory protein UreE [Marinobacter sp. F3R08]MBU2953661.1 urease accessory protein UreE [Marinobacter sp. F3R08]
MLELTERIGDVNSTGIDTSEILDNLILPYELRIRGRLRATTETNVDVGLFLDRGPVLRDGDLLQAKTGEIIRIRAAEEQVVTARIENGQPLARLCYHLGNRHVTLAIGMDEQGAYVRITPDHVLEELAERLGATLMHHTAPFDPEPGAYTQAGYSHGHGHSHSHDHDHGHSHGHSHKHTH